VAIASGRNTELDHINDMMSVIETAKTPLLLQIDELGMICSDKTTPLTINERTVKAVVLVPYLIHDKKCPVRRAFFYRRRHTLCNNIIRRCDERSGIINNLADSLHSQAS